MDKDEPNQNEPQEEDNDEVKAAQFLLQQAIQMNAPQFTIDEQTLVCMKQVHKNCKKIGSMSVCVRDMHVCGTTQSDKFPGAVT